MYSKCLLILKNVLNICLEIEGYYLVIKVFTVLQLNVNVHMLEYKGILEKIYVEKKQNKEPGVSF